MRIPVNPRHLSLKVAAIAAFLVANAASAAVVATYSGKLNDPTNTALIGSDEWTASTMPPAASFSMTDDSVSVDNVALYQLVVAAAGSYEFKSILYAAGGIDPYFTIFSGLSGDATFVASNYYRGIGDFDITQSLGIGTYTLAIGVDENESFAENYGAPLTLSDGFIGFSTGSLGDSDSPYYYGYSVVVSTVDDTSPGTPGNTVPEPAPLLLMAAPIVAWALRRRADRIQEVTGLRR